MLNFRNNRPFHLCTPTGYNGVGNKNFTYFSFNRRIEALTPIVVQEPRLTEVEPASACPYKVMLGTSVGLNKGKKHRRWHRSFYSARVFCPHFIG